MRVLCSLGVINVIYTFGGGEGSPGTKITYFLNVNRSDNPFITHGTARFNNVLTDLSFFVRVRDGGKNAFGTAHNDGFINIVATTRIVFMAAKWTDKRTSIIAWCKK